MNTEHNPRGGLNDTERTSLVRRLLDMSLGRRFGGGYDFFISYCWADGRAYALILNAELKKRGFRSFLDSEDYEKGSDWRTEGRRALKQSSRMLLVLTPGSIGSEPVSREIQHFCETGRTILPIDVVNVWRSSEAAVLRQRIGEAILNIPEPGLPEIVLATGPSDATLADITNSFNLRRQSERRVRAFGIAAGVFLMLGLIALGLAGAAYYERGLARTARDETQNELARAQFALGRVPFESRKIDEALLWWTKSASTTKDPDWRASMAHLIGAWSATIPVIFLEEARVVDVMFSPSGKSLLTASGTRARLWNPRTGRL